MKPCQLTNGRCSPVIIGERSKKGILETELNEIFRSINIKVNIPLISIKENITIKYNNYKNNN
jgi:hypothetical protein